VHFEVRSIFAARPRGGVLPLVAAILFFLAAPARADIAAYLVIDARTGAVLEEMNAMRPWHPASLTKMMTAYVTFAALRGRTITLNSPVRFSDNARAQPPSKMGFKTGTILTVDNALKMMLVKSANDVAVALGESVAGSESAFVNEMNGHARRLGMSSTRFANPNGLPNRAQITTARDFAILAMALNRDFPEYAHYFRIGAIKHGKRVLKNYNVLLHHYRGADGFKTGYICDSGLNLVASATRGGRRIIAVVMGARTGYERAAVARTLLDRGFASGGGSGLFSRAGGTITQMRPKHSWPALPPQGYCRSGNKPSTDDLLAQYGRVPQSESIAAASLAYAGNDNIRQPLPGVAASAAPSKTAKKSTKQKKPKISGEELLNRLVGPQLSVAVVPVFVGGADMSRPIASFKPIDGVQLSHAGPANVLPKPHPGRGNITPPPGAASSALGIQPVRSPSGAAATASIFANGRNQRATGQPANLLPQGQPVMPQATDGIPLPRPHPNR